MDSSDIKISENNIAKIGGGIYLDNVNVKLNNVTLNNDHANMGSVFYNAGSITLISIKLDFSKAIDDAGIYNTKNLKNLIINDLKANKNITSIK